MAEIKDSQIIRNFEVYASIKDFRLCSISRLDMLEDNRIININLPMKDGIAVEYRIGTDPENYVVIALVKVNKDGYYDGYQSVEGRIEEYCPTWETIRIFRQLLLTAEMLIEFDRKSMEEL